MQAYPLAGHLSVEASAGRIRHYRYAEERMMRILGGWIALTPELPAKLLFGRHVWDCAQHADLWGRRLPELRAPAQQSEPANLSVVRFVELLERAQGPRETAARITGIYRVLKPHLVTLYARHLAAANAIYEPPTRRILARCLEEERRHVAAGAVVFDRLVREPGERARAAEGERRLVAALGEAGGIGGDGDGPLISVDPGPTDPQALAQDLVRVPPEHDPPELSPELAAAVEAHGRALVASDLAGASGQVAASAWPAVRDVYASLPGLWTGSAVLALAKIGAYRVVKLRLDGPRARSVLQLRWQRGDTGWQVVGAEIARSEPLP